MTPFKTNSIKLNLNRTAIANRYDVFLVRKEGEYIKRGSLALDVPLVEKRVCSVRFESRNTFYVLMEKGECNRNCLLDALKQTDEIDKICLPPIRFEDIDDRLLLQLLINSLGSSSNPVLRINNLTGHLYCYKSAWIQENKKDHFKEQVSCLEVLVTKDMKLTLPVKTFTSERCKDQIIFRRKHPYESYPKYIFSKFQTMARKPKDCDEDEYIQRQKFNNKFNVDFLRFETVEKFSESKMGVLNEIVDRFNTKFEGLAHIDFNEVDEYESVKRDRLDVKQDEQILKDSLDGKKFNIIDLIGSSESEVYCKEVQKKLEPLCGSKPSISANKIKDGLNICIVHKKEWYKDKDDLYGTITGAAVQHITIEDFRNKDANLKSIINELVIKHDNDERKFSLYDWNKAGINHDISFGLKFDKNDEYEKEIYCFMTVHPDGTFEFSKKDSSDLFDYNVYTQCVSIFSSSEDVDGIVMDHEGHINVIKKTDWITIPEIKKIKDEFKQDRVHEFRSEAGREEFLSACTDIKMFEQDGGKYYFVGVIGRGMRANVPNAANIRCIEPYENAPVFFDKLLPLMNTPYIHNQRLTVIPFPFKYLREWVKSKPKEILQ